MPRATWSAGFWAAAPKSGQTRRVPSSRAGVYQEREDVGTIWNGDSFADSAQARRPRAFAGGLDPTHRAVYRRRGAGLSDGGDVDGGGLARPVLVGAGRADRRHAELGRPAQLRRLHAAPG